MTSKRFKRTTETIFAPVGKDIVALQVGRGQCYGMDEIAAAVWTLLSQPMNLGQLCEHLIERYDVGAERCQSEVLQLLNQMIAEGLVEAA